MYIHYCIFVSQLTRGAGSLNFCDKNQYQTRTGYGLSRLVVVPEQISADHLSATTTTKLRERKVCTFDGLFAFPKADAATLFPVQREREREVLVSSYLEFT